MGNKALRIAAICFVFLAIVWTGSFVVDVLGDVIASDGFVMQASPDATFGMSNGRLELVSGSGGITRYDGGIFTGIFPPFLIVAMFALYGAWNLGSTIKK